MSLSLRVRPVVVPGLVPVGARLPHVLQQRVDERLADEDAQVDHQEGVHRPARGGAQEAFFYTRTFEIWTLQNRYLY